MFMERKEKYMKLEFKTCRSTLASKTDKTVCNARAIHTAILRDEALIDDMCETLHMDRTLVQLALTLVSSYIPAALSRGKKLDFGPFSLALTITGAFDGANDEFQPGRNSIGVIATASKRLKKALSNLEPVNATPAPSPKAKRLIDDKNNQEGVLSPGAQVFISGTDLGVSPDAPDEGVWLCDDAGERLSKAVVTASTSTTLNCVFPVSPAIAPGRYTLFIASRNRDPTLGAPGICRRSVEVKTHGDSV